MGEVCTNNIAIGLAKQNTANISSATNNYWGTVDIQVIENMILDRKDSLDYPCVVEYSPFLDSSHQDTPFFEYTPNTPPTASAGQDQIVFDAITLDGNQSSDPDGAIASYVWQLLYRGDSSYNRSAEGVNPTITNLNPGFYDTILTVTDNDGAVSVDNMIFSAAGIAFTQQQLDQAVADAEAAKDLIITEKDKSIAALNTTIAAMFTQAQVDKAISEERIKWDINNDGKMGLVEVIYILQMIAAVR